MLLASYNPGSHFFSASTPTMSIVDEAIPFLDLVVTGWVVCMRDIESRRGNSSTRSNLGNMNNMMAMNNMNSLGNPANPASPMFNP